MTTGDEGDEHQMERRLQWEATAYKGQCNEQRGPKATLPEGCEGEATMIEGDPNAHVPLVQSTTLRSEVVIAKVILTARAQTEGQRSRRRSRSDILAPGGP